MTEAKPHEGRTGSLRERAGVREAARAESARIESGFHPRIGKLGPCGLPHPGPRPEGEGAGSVLTPYAVCPTPRRALLSAAAALPLFAIRTRPADMQNVVQAELRQAALDQRADEARLDTGLNASSSYTDWHAKFGDQAWAALESVSGDLA